MRRRSEAVTSRDRQSAQRVLDSAHKNLDQQIEALYGLSPAERMWIRKEAA
jgi:hypothetical protein